MSRKLTEVRGYRAWGAHIGIKSKRRDLAIVHSERVADIALVTTRNLVVAEPVKLARKHAEGGKAQVLVVNAGNANACTGQQGKQGAAAMASTAAEELGIPRRLVQVASTGVIGRRFPTAKVVEGIRDNMGKLSKRATAASFVANAILTTDTFAKEAFASFELGGQEVRLAGIAKGSGMIHPDMGTMLAFLFCDAAIEQPLLDRAFRDAVDRSFNMITVDGDTSTNDTALVMCNGLAGNEPIRGARGRDYRVFREQLQRVCMDLARQIVSDGEGATKHIEYRVTGAPSEAAARKVVRTISGSSLVKTAIYGRDPNWGRIIAAAGRSGVQFDPDKLDLYMGSTRLLQVLAKGRPTDQDLARLKKMMRSSGIQVQLDLHAGRHEAVGWGTDLTEEYVRFNSQYTT